MRILQLTIGLLVPIALLAMPDALAQVEPMDANEVAALEEIIVTAQKREQKLIDVPQSLQVFTQDLLVQANIRDVSEMINFIPGASEGLAFSVGQRRFQIRGLYQESGSATVGYYLGEVPIDGDTAAPLGRLFDMQRVEVLRGPQSTLYGNGAMGGVVRYIPNEPDLQAYQAGVHTGFSIADSADNGYFGDAYLSIPVIEDQLAIRLVASAEKLGGYADQFNGEKNINGANLTDFRFHVLWKPIEDLEIKLLYSNDKANQDANNILSGLFPNETISIGGPADYQNNKLEIISGTIGYYGFGFADLVSTFSDVKFNNDGKSYFDLPGLSAVTSLIGNEIHTFSNETRLVSKSEGPLSWMIGGYFTNGDTTRAADYTWDPEIPPYFVSSSTTTKDNRDTYSFFGEASWGFMDGKLVPLIGVRYSHESNDGDTVAAAGAPNGRNFNNTKFRFNLSWFPTEASHYYLNIAQGFRSGVFNSQQVCFIHNLLLIEGTCELILDTDELVSYEAGAKYTLMGGRLFIDSAIYYQDWQRTPQQLPIGGLYATYDVGDSQLYGIDFSMMYQPESVEGLDFSITANWNSSEFDKVVPIVAATLLPPYEPDYLGAVSGERLPFVPAWTLTAAANYVWSISDSWDGLFNITLNHLDGQYGQFGANAGKGGSRNLLRARFGVQKGRVGLFLFGRNLFNEDATIFAQAPSGGIPAFTIDYPRQIGIEVNWDLN
ncbi:MAG: TonB-dependent receptor [Xanthomonadales bacterium]|nr:TonB-dependent receptor [Xanthomonadales bacterium]